MTGVQHHRDIPVADIVDDIEVLLVVCGVCILDVAVDGLADIDQVKC